MDITIKMSFLRWLMLRSQLVSYAHNVVSEPYMYLNYKLENKEDNIVL